MYKIVPSKKFLKQIKKYSKKFKNLGNDIEELYNLLSQDPKSGVFIKNNVYKIRIKNSDNNKGKSGGYRVMTYVVDENNKVYLLTIYSKSELDNIEDHYIDELIEEVKSIQESEE